MTASGAPRLISSWLQRRPCVSGIWGSGKYSELLLRGSATPKMAAYLFALVLPPVLSFALPVGTLVGVLIGLGRMSAEPVAGAGELPRRLEVLRIFRQARGPDGFRLLRARDALAVAIQRVGVFRLTWSFRLKAEAT